MRAANCAVIVRLDVRVFSDAFADTGFQSLRIPAEMITRVDLGGWGWTTGIYMDKSAFAGCDELGAIIFSGMFADEKAAATAATATASRLQSVGGATRTAAWRMPLPGGANRADIDGPASCVVRGDWPGEALGEGGHAAGAVWAGPEPALSLISLTAPILVATLDGEVYPVLWKPSINRELGQMTISKMGTKTGTYLIWVLGGHVIGYRLGLLS